MDTDQIRELVRLMVENDLDELDVTEGESTIRLRRNVAAEVVNLPAPASAPLPVMPAPTARAAPPEEELIDVKSPMVGTFYAAASPDAEVFVTIGSKVAEDTVVCIIEAMKVMNELKAECTGEIAEVCVRNAEPVEYGQVLFRVRPV